MATVAIDSTGVLLIDGATSFPIGFSEPPPIGATTPNGVAALDELRKAGGTMIRTGPADFATPAAAADWSLPQIDSQIAKVKARMDEAHAHGLHCWLYLGKAPNLPTTPNSPQEQLLEKIVTAVKAHPSLTATQGLDEPRNRHIPAAGLVRAYQKIKALDPDHPVVIIQAPRKPAPAFTSYRPAFDVTGVDIFPVSYAAQHSDSSNKDVSVVGEMTKKMVTAAGGKPVWLTLQIAWVGITPGQQHPDIVPRFPTLQEERFMAYQAIVNGARGLIFFGGQLTQVMRPRDAQLGWNWTFLEQVLRPLMVELTLPSVLPALTAST